MSISADVTTDAFGNITVLMKGGLNFETNPSIRRELNDLATQYPYAQILIDMNSVDFVGSSGIGIFIETLRFLNRIHRERVRLCNVNEEFQKVFKLYTKEEEQFIVENYEFESDDLEGFSRFYGKKRRLFEN